MRKLIVAALLLGATAIGMLFMPATGAAQDAATTDTVTVGARRTVDVEPDRGIVTLQVRSRAVTAEAAANELSRRARRVVAALESEEFADEEIDTVDISLYRRCVQGCRGRDSEPVYRFVGSAGVRLRTSDIEGLNEAIDVGIEGGATGVRQVSFDVEDKAEAEKQALRRAFAFAEEKAQVLADASGRTVGRVLVIEEGNTRAPEEYFFDGDFAEATAADGGGESAAAFPIEPPTLQASGQVTVTFQLQ